MYLLAVFAAVLFTCQDHLLSLLFPTVPTTYLNSLFTFSLPESKISREKLPHTGVASIFCSLVHNSALTCIYVHFAQLSHFA